ncbi:hypothetical protein MMC08_000466 [Hypocenomyce scalaris]|nr:hypothetical protein [Hypocenomyce scalaris]
MDTPTAKTLTGYLLSLVLCAGSIRAILDPVAQSHVYGIPATSAAASAYVTAMGARTLAIGLAVGTFVYRGERRAAGTVLCLALVVGAVDTWATWRSVGGWNAAVWSHVVGDGLFVVAGRWLMG